MKKAITISAFLLITQFALTQIIGCITCDTYMISDTTIDIDTLMGYKNDKNKKIVTIYKISLKQYDSLHHMNRMLIWYFSNNDNYYKHDNYHNIDNLIKEIKEKKYDLTFDNYSPDKVFYFEKNEFFSYYRLPGSLKTHFRFGGGYYSQFRWAEYAYFFSNNKTENKKNDDGSSFCKIYFKYKKNIYLKGKKIYDAQRIKAVYNTQIGLISFRIKDDNWHNFHITHVYGQPLRQYLRHPKHPMKCKW